MHFVALIYEAILGKMPTYLFSLLNYRKYEYGPHSNDWITLQHLELNLERSQYIDISYCTYGISCLFGLAVNMSNVLGVVFRVVDLILSLFFILH